MGRLAAALYLFVGSCMGFAQTYSVFRLGLDPQGRVAVVRSINNNHELLVQGSTLNGWYWTSATGWVALPHIGQYRDQTVFELTDNGFAYYVDFNDAGQYQPFRWHRTLGWVTYDRILDGTYSDTYGGNNDGWFVGGNLKSGSISKAYLMSPWGTALDLGHLPGDENARANDINDDGVIVGDSYGPTHIPYGFYRQPDGTMLQVPWPLGTDQASCYYLNSSGLGVGTCFFTANLRATGFYWKPGLTPTVIPGFRPVSWQPFGLNNLGHVVGYELSGTNPEKGGLFWRPGMDKAIYVGEHLDATGNGWYVRSVQGINDKGQLGGNGKFNGGAFEAIVLTPKSVPVRVAGAELQGGGPVAGNLRDLDAADGKALRLSPSMAPNAGPARVSLVVASKTARQALYLWLKTRMRSTLGVKLQVRAALWDFQSGHWDKEAPAEWGLGDAWASNELIAKRDVRRYTGPDGTVRARLDVFGPPSSVPWTVDLDLAQWEVVWEE